ncbi:24378_t:CDS:2, partial [Racocetra persica]
EEARRLYKFVLTPTELVTHDQWVEQNHDRERVVKGITDVLLQEIKTDILRRVDKGSENTLVGSIARLIDVTMYRLPIGCEIEKSIIEYDSPAPAQLRHTSNITAQRFGTRDFKNSISGTYN